MLTNYIEEPGQCVFLLGADDPEMRAISEVLKAANCEVRYATADGRRVHPGNAYKADVCERGELTLVLVECEPLELSGGEWIRIDHHRPGDPGYGLGPARFWEASSLGQIATRMHQWPSDLFSEYKVLAAMDHCPAAAIRGECPGVAPEAVVALKVVEIARATGEPEGVVGELIDRYTLAIAGCPSVDGLPGVVNLTAEELGCGYSAPYLTAQVAALANGCAVLLRHRDTPEGAEKVVLSGHATPEMIERFISDWGPTQGLIGIYGVPERGYAGGYRP